MGEYADETLERDLAAYWASLEDDPRTWPVAGKARPMGRGHTSNPRPTNQGVFAAFDGLDLTENGPKDGPVEIDYGAF